VRSSLSVDWVGLATLTRAPGMALLRQQRDLVGMERPGSQQRAPAEPCPRDGSATSAAAVRDNSATGKRCGLPSAPRCATSAAV
jgi:hypothetical protein